MFRLVDFLRLDLDVGLTMARIAAHAKVGSEKRVRTTGKARIAYETVCRLRKRSPAAIADQSINNKLSNLRTALERLGDGF